MTDNLEILPAKPVWKRRWFRIISISAISLILILAVIPAIISSNLKSWLLNNGADNVVIENIDFNPFTGTAAVHGLDIKIADKTVMSNTLVYLDISLLALLKKGFAVENAILNDVLIDIEQLDNGKIRVGSLLIDPAKKTKEEIKEEVKKEIRWWLNLGKVTLNKCVIQYQSPKLVSTLFLDDLSLENLSTRGGEQKAKLDMTARLNQSDIRAIVTLTELSPAIHVSGDISAEKLNLQDFSGLTTEILSQLAGSVDIAGDISINISDDKAVNARFTGKTKASSHAIAGKGFTIEGTEAGWNGSISFLSKAGGAQQNIDLDGELAATGYTVKLDAFETAGTEARWQGKAGYAQKAASSPRNIIVAGNLNGKALTLELPKQNLSIQQNEINLSPELSIQISNEKTDLSGTASAVATGTIVSDIARNLTLVAINDLAINDLKADSLQQASIRAITINESKFIQGKNSEKPSFSLLKTELDSIAYAATKGLEINRISIGKLDGSLVREKDGTIDIAKALKAPEGETAKASPTEEEPANEQVDATTQPTTDGHGFGLKISEFTIKDDSTITFTDRSVTPTFNSELNIASLQLRDIDSSQPEQPIAVNLDSKVDNYATFTVKGAVKPFLQQPAIDLKIDLSHLNMVSLSPHMIKATGYLVRAGQLNIDSSIAISNHTIDAKNTLFMKKLHLEEANAALIKENAGSIGMPLDKALGMLQDKNDNIKLEVPITGKLDEVDIGTGQIINTALKKATTAGMKTYLLYAFQPYGAMIIAGQMVGKQVGKIRLDPVFYDAGKNELTSQQKNYLEKLGKVMQDRPKIDVQICAYTTAADLSLAQGGSEKSSSPISQAQIDETLKVGLQRQKEIKDYLISKYKIDDGRLLLCSPKFDDSKDAKPRVELLI